MIAVDIGNSRMKWGHWPPGGALLMASLPLDSPDEWTETREWWELSEAHWVVASVNQPARERFREWAVDSGDTFTVIASHRDVPLELDVDHPEGVGIDRLLAALAAKERLSPGESAVIVDAGTAVTVDYLDGEGVFRGGAIMPGFRLMASALHEHTAALPEVEVRSQVALSPGRNTEEAIRTGIYWAVAGGIRALAVGYGPARCLLTGGSPGLAEALGAEFEHVPGLTLEGIRLAGEHLAT